jgi:peptidylprolyl isomerase
MKRIILASVIILTAILVLGCGGGETQPTGNGQAAAQDGDTVAVHYTGTLSDGSKFDSSYDRGEPLEFVLGDGNMISGFENAVRGMQVGEVKTVTLPPEEAYGTYDENLILVLGRDQMPQGIDIEVGLQLPMQTDTGARFIATIIEVSDTTVTLDANHPMAGKELTFEIELVAITPAP